MYPSVSPSKPVRRRALLLAVLQVVLLTSSLVLAPALVIAQESPDPSPPSKSAEPQASSEPAAEDQAHPGPAAHAALQPEPAQPEPQPEPASAQPTPEEPAPAEPSRELFVHPDTLKLTLGESALVRAWSCLADAKPPFGEDKDPGTLDDTCRDVEADWSVTDSGVADLAKDEAARTRVTALATTEGTKLIAQRGDQIARAELVITPVPDPEPKPEAGAPDPATEGKRADQDAARPDEPKVDEPKPDDPAPDESRPDEAKAVEPEAAPPSQTPPLLQALPPSQAPDVAGVGALEPDASVVPVDEAPTEEPSVEALEPPVSSEASAPPATDAGDGGLPEALTPNVVMLPAAVDVDGNGLLDDMVTLESPPGTILLDVSAVPVPTDPAPPEGIVFPVGLFDYRVAVANPGDPADVTFRLPEGVVSSDTDTVFWVLQDDQWTDLTPSAEVDVLAAEVTVTLVDGGTGDADSSADGIIDDPSGPAIESAANNSTITARVWGDRLGGGSNQPLGGVTMGLWRGDGDGTFEPGGDDQFVTSCVTGADGTCVFTSLPSGPYWVQQISPPPGGVYTSILTWAPGDSSRANSSVPYAADRNRDPAGGGPIRVDGSNAKTTDWFGTRRSNPDISEISCQQLMRIVLVLDRSGSIQTNGASFYKNAVTSFVQDLVGTNTEIAVVSFAENATTDLGYRSVLNGNIDPILNAINSVYSRLGGGTNWDRGLSEVDGIGINPDLVLMVTDGNPTLSRSSGDASKVNWGDFTEAVTSANLVKSGGGAAPASRIIAVAAGAAGSISVDGLIGITGPQVNQPDALDDDYVLGTPDELAARLREIALARCGASVKVKKEVATTPGQWDPGVGWSFDVSISPQTKVTPVPPADTDAGGLITFEWISSADRAVTITERDVPPATAYRNPTFTCWDGPDFAGNVIADGDPGDGPRSITITVPVDTDYSCLFRNRPEPVEQVVRKYNDKNGDGVRQPDTEPLIDTWTLWLDLDRDGVQGALEPTRTTDGGEARFNLLPTARYQICEVTQAGWINTDPGAGSTSPTAPCKETGLIEPGREADIVRFGNDKPDPVEQVVRKYSDKNGDGVRQPDTEPLIDTWTFWLDLDRDGVQDAGEPKRSTERGEATFSLLPNAEYWICEVTQDDWVNTDPGAASLSPTAPCKSTGFLEPRVEPGIVRFGNVSAEPIEQVVRKYHDLNADGRRQAETEPLIDTWTFWLDLNKDGIRGIDEPTRTTDGGEVVFSLPPNAEYWICEVTQLGWINSEPGAASLSPAAPCKATGLIMPRDDTGVVKFGNYATNLAIEKSAEPDWFDEVGDEITYTITATNTSDGPLTGVTVSDPLLDRLPGWSCSPALPATLAAGAAVVCRAVYTVTAADLAAGSVPNSACADSVETDQICNSVVVPAISLDVKKTANRDRIPVTGMGVPVTFTFTVTNTAAVPVEIVSLTDSDFGVLEGSGDCQVGTVLQPGESCSFQATFRLKPEGGGPDGPLPHENTFRACVTPPDASIGGLGDFAIASGDPVCDRDDAVVNFFRPDRGGGAGGGGDGGGDGDGGDQPPTDMLLPSAIATPVVGGGPFDGTTGWILWVLLATSLILSGGSVIRRVRYSET